MKSIEELIGIMNSEFDANCLFISEKTKDDIVTVLENHSKVLDENADLHRNIEDMEKYIASFKCEIERLNQRPPKTQTRYKVVRSFAPNSSASADYLEEAFNDGWEFVRASEFVPAQGNKVGYIEYVLKKEIEVQE